MNKKVLWIIAGIVGCLVLICGCAAMITPSKDKKNEGLSSAASTNQPFATAHDYPTVWPSETASPSPLAPAVKEWGDGVWTVGEDIPPGTYKVTAAVSAGCYWSITVSGSNGDNIVANALPSGGYPKVTLKKGQDFETEDCGTWKKVK